MVLPSQVARSDARRSHMYRRKRSRRTPVLAVGVVLVVVAGWLLVNAWTGGDEGDSGSNGALAANGGAAPHGESPVPIDDNRGAGDSAGTTKDGDSRVANDADRDAVNSESDDATVDAGPPDDGSFTAELLNSWERDGAAGTEPTVEEMQRARQQVMYGFQIADSRPLEARRVFTDALRSGAVTADDAWKMQIALRKINDELLFSPTIHPEDPFVRSHSVKRNESLEKIVKQQSLLVDWRFIRRINGIEAGKEHLLREGQTLKLVTGPFHAVISKGDYRLDLYLGDDADQVFVASYKVGLGEYDSTPVGMFKIGSKLINPEWRNPRNSREHYLPDDPSNPLGERWIQLIGVDEHTSEFTGYGIHGTIEPESIGSQQSMGCVRMLPEDVEVVYEVLLADVSTVEIRP